MSSAATVHHMASPGHEASAPVRFLRSVRDRTALWPTVKEHAPPLFALAGLAVAQPLLDLFGRNPEFFVASDMTQPEIAVFGIVIALGVPSVCTAAVVAAGAVGGAGVARFVARTLVAVLAFAFGLTIARQVGLNRTIAAGALGLAVAAAIVALLVRFSGFRQALRYLAFAPIGFLLLFLFASESSALLFDAEAVAARDVVVGSPAPVVMVVLDEVPTASLMRADGTLNEERFPNFARLADAGTWYRTATSVSPNTPNSLPTILDGDLPATGALPTSTDHPESLFTLLGDRYDLDVTETVTELCPSSVCVPAEGQSLGSFFERLGQSLSDATVVYGHTSLPRRFRQDLPAVDQTWGGFIDDTGPGAIDATQPQPEADETPVEFLQRQVSEREGQNPDLGGETLRQSFAQSSVNDDNDLLFVHEVFPHFPWVRTPTGGVYENRPGPPGTEDNAWGDNEFLITQGLQRHLLQLGYADVALGDLIDKLEADGVWDDTIVVVTADHGISFTAGQTTRSPTDENAHEIYNVPLFIKEPGGPGGVIDDDPARTIDIVPTIVDLLDIETLFTFDGTSLVGSDRADTQPVVFGRGPEEITGGVAPVIRIAERNATRMPTGDGWAAVPATGRYGALIGTDLDDLAVRSGGDRRWSVDQEAMLNDLDLEAGVVPLILTGEIDGGDDGGDLLIAVNGTVAGVVGFEGAAGAPAFSALLDESLFRAGTNQVELLSVGGPVVDPRVVTSGPPS